MRDSRGRSPDPRPLGDMLGALRQEIAPRTPLAATQGVWEEVVGPRIAAVTEVSEEREGVVTVECSSAAWAQELELMAPRINARLTDRLGDTAPEKLRFRATI